MCIRDSHNVPTVNIFDIRDAISKAQIDKLAENVIEFGIDNASHGSDKQGIVHMVGPETGRTQPGKFIVCGDSHTATHGAFGAIAFGIGTSEVEMCIRDRPLAELLWTIKRDCDRLLSWLVRKIKHYRFILLVFTIRFILIFQR